AGVAMGLILERDAEIVLTDILGAEDHWGDMDFKVAGTKDGITAFQMDCKVSGVSRDLLERALNQAKEARLYVLEKLYETIDRPRERLSKYAPIIKVTSVDPSRVAEIIGPGGRVIKGIIKDYDVKISVDDLTGRVSVIGDDQAKVDAAIRQINSIVKEIVIGEIFEGKVTRTEPFGVFVEVAPGKVGLLHQSKLVSNLKSIKLGDVLKVKVSNIDNSGRFQLEEISTDQVQDQSQQHRPYRKSKREE
ncbi:MAG: S1 RNA-binding domain-containing protein, partial [Pseudothermotoga sp.]